MSKYSSDSDSSRWSDRRRKKKSNGRVRERSKSSSEYDSDSDSNYSYKKKYHKHKRGKSHRSRSRDRYSSRRTHRVRAHDERSHSSLRSRSGSRTRSRRSSKSPARGRGKGRSRSSSQSRGRDQKHKKKSRRKSRERSQYQSSSSSSNDSISKSPSPMQKSSLNSAEAGRRERTVEELHTKLQKVIKAAQTSDNHLRLHGMLNKGSAQADDANEDLTLEATQRINTIDEINDVKEFVPKQFTSSRSKQKAVERTSFAAANALLSTVGAPLATVSMPVTVTTDTTALTEAKLAELAVDKSGSIFHTSLMVDPQLKLDRWVKKLFHLRQRALHGEPLS